ncbi:hypothetical protein D5086_000853 [Populus alba]|uniref:Uncharacterized protein n=1 Tax=Populus alba TaxID=43335 RepID=A0ACC4CX20_POPAL
MSQNDRSWHEKQPLDFEKSKEAPRKSSYVRGQDNEYPHIVVGGEEQKLLLSSTLSQEFSSMRFQKRVLTPVEAKVIKQEFPFLKSFSSEIGTNHLRNLLQFKSKTQEANVVERELVKSSAPHALLPLTKKQLQLDQNPKIPCVYP